MAFKSATGEGMLRVKVAEGLAQAMESAMALEALVGRRMNGCRGC